VRAVKVLLASLRSTLTPAPSARKRSLGFHAKKFVAAENEAKRFVPRTKLLRLLNKVSRPFILQDEILDRRWIRGLVLAQIRAQSMISQQEPQVDWRQTRQTYTRACGQLTLNHLAPETGEHYSYRRGELPWSSFNTNLRGPDITLLIDGIMGPATRAIRG
jgi:hypothetical protein